MQNPRPISDAPTDGTVVITDHGCAKYVNEGEGQTPGWYQCTPTGYILCKQYDENIGANPASNTDPTVFVGMPDWMGI